MIASLPMYDRPEVAEAHDRYWQLIRGELGSVGIESPFALARDADESSPWTDPALVLSQTCGMPYRNDLHGKVTLIGTPDFELEGCAPGYQRSAFVVRNDDPRTSLAEFEQAIFAFNHTQSQSGYNAAFHYLAPLGFWFANQVQSGQHIASARMVAEGRADIAALDAVSWRLMQRYDEFSNELRVLDWTQTTPGLPYISAAGMPAEAMFEAVANAIAAMSSADRQQLGISGLVAIPATEYLAVPNYY